jgi:hypothetical protein
MKPLREPPRRRARPMARASARSEGDKRRRAREGRTFRRPAVGEGRPTEYDESGFPIPQRLPSYAQRVRRRILGARVD